MKRADREKLCEIVFEKLNFKNVFFSRSSTLTAFAVGRTTGVVLDSGNSFTTATIVHDGYSFVNTCKRNSYAGMALSSEIDKYITETLKVDLTPEVALK